MVLVTASDGFSDSFRTGFSDGFCDGLGMVSDGFY